MTSVSGRIMARRTVLKSTCQPGDYLCDETRSLSPVTVESKIVFDELPSDKF
jgi:hypothetical protein